MFVIFVARERRPLCVLFTIHKSFAKLSFSFSLTTSFTAAGSPVTRPSCLPTCQNSAVLGDV